MQRVGVQCSGSRFPSSLPRVSPLDRCSLCVCRKGLYQEAHSAPVTDTFHATKQRCRRSPIHYISRVLQSPHPCPKEVRRLESSHQPVISQHLPRDSSLHDGKCGNHSAISPSRRLGHFDRSCGCLFPHTHPQRLSKISSISDSGHHIPIPGTTVWPFSSTLGIYKDYDRYQNAGTRDGHQSLSVPGRLAHLFTISRPVPSRHCTSPQSLPHDGSPHSRQEVGTDPKTEIPFSGIQVRPSFLLCHSNSESISKNQSTNPFIPAKPRRMCSYSGRSCSVSLRPQKNWFLWDGYTPAKPNIASLNAGISML